MKFIVGIKILALVSLLLGFLLLFVCGWTFHSFLTREISLSANVTKFEVQNDGENESPRHKDNSQESSPENEADSFREILNEITTFKAGWSEYKKFLIGSNGLALFSGLIQVITNLLLICTGVKDIRSRSGCWKCTHFFIGTILTVSIIVPAVFDLSQTSLTTLRELYTKISTNDLEKFKEVEVYYGILALDISVVFILIILSCCLMRNADYDYEYA